MAQEQDAIGTESPDRDSAVAGGFDDQAGENVAVSRSHVYLGLTRAEMNWAAVAHASVVVTVLLGVATGGLGALVGIIIPATIWAANRRRSEYVADQARQATIFQLLGIAALLTLAIIGALLLVLGWVVTALLTIALVGLILIPVMIVVTVLFLVALVSLPIAQTIYGCYGALEARAGRSFRYRWIAGLMDRGAARGDS